MSEEEKTKDSENKLKKNKHIITVEIDEELYKILESLKDYVENISYGSMRPSTREASKLLAKKIQKRGGIV